MIDELMTQTEAEALLAPHYEALTKCLRDAWRDWHDLIKVMPRFASSRKVSRANLVYDRMKEYAEAYFDSVGVPTDTRRGFLTVLLGDRVVLRFKKFRDSSFRTSGIPTAQRLEIESQQVTLDGLAMTYLTVGYLPDELGVELDALAVVCSFNGRAVWVIDLNAEASGVATPIATTPPTRPTVRSTRPAAREDQAEGN